MIKIMDTPAETCRENGIKVGTRLISSTTHGWATPPTVAEVCIEITKIGFGRVEAKTISDNRRGPSGPVSIDIEAWRDWAVLD